jgi:hypothetical protein
MVTVFLRTTNQEMVFPHELIDLNYSNLDEFAQALMKS